MTRGVKGVKEGRRMVDDAAIAELEGLVHSVAGRVRRRFQLDVDRDDLVQLGMLGLCEAADRYDPDSGVALSTFAYTRIRGAILDGVGRMTGVKRGQVRRARRLAAANEYVESLDHASPDAEPVRYVSDAVEGVLFTSCLAELVEDRAAAEQDGDSPLKSSPERSLGRSELRHLVLQVLRDMPPDEGSLLHDHYVEGRTLAEIGEERGVSRSWASRIHTRALRRAREILTESHGVAPADLADATWP